jgi:recombinational DNA repair protein (RecF pathway)
MKMTPWARRTGNKCRECGEPLKPVGFDAGRPQEFCEACNLERIRARKRAWNARQKTPLILAGLLCPPVALR